MEGFIKEILKFLKKGLDENLADRVRSLDALKFKPPSDTRLPFWSTTEKSSFSKIATISFPERTFNLGMRADFELKIREDGRFWS